MEAAESPNAGMEDMSSVSQINSNMHGIANCLINALTGQVDFRTKSTCPVIRLIGTYLLF